jgi:DNA-binding IclR family transcriptional regulator
MRALADEFDLVCTAFFLEGDMIHVRERAASVSHVGVSVPVGSRIRLRASAAPIFYAWSPQPQIDAWALQLDPEQRDVLEKGLGFARRYGFYIQVDDVTPRGFAPAAQLLDEAAFANSPVKVVTELKPGDSYPIATVLAPVFDAEGKVAFAMGLHGFERDMKGAQVAEIAGRLRAACDRITGYIGGHSGSSLG